MTRLTAIQQDLLVDQHIFGAGINTIGGYMEIPTIIDSKRFHTVRQTMVQCTDAISLAIKEDHSPRLFSLSQQQIPQLVHQDFSQHEEVIAEQLAKEWVMAQHHAGFTQLSACLFEDALIKIKDDLWWYYAKGHHTIIDGWGFSLWGRLLIQRYERYCQDGSVCQSCANHFSFIDAINRENDYLKGARYRIDQQYWLQKYAKVPTPLFHHSNKQLLLQQPVSQRVSKLIDATLYQQIIALGQKNKLGTLSVFIGVICLYFSRLMAKDELVIGMPIHGRNNAAAKQVIGMLSNIIATPFKINTQMNFVDLLVSVGQELRGNRKHQRFPYGHLNRLLNIDYQERKYLFDISLNYQAFNLALALDEQTVTTHYLTNHFELTPLAFIITEYNQSQKVDVHLDYRTDIWQAHQAEALLEHLLFLCEQVCINPELPLTDYQLLPSTEIHQLTQRGYGGVMMPEYPSLQSLLAAQFIMLDQSMAIMYREQRLTYQELAIKVDALVGFLKQQGVNKQAIVGILLDSSIDLVIAILSCLFVEGIFVPLLPSIPLSRLQYMVQDANLDLILTSSKQIGHWHDKFSVPILCVDLIPEQRIDPKNLQELYYWQHCKKSDEQALTYILYTSGSTGRPKGVQVKTTSLFNCLLAMEQQLDLGSSLQVLSVSSPAFDISLLDYLLPLLFGGTLYLLDAQQFREPQEIIQLLQKYPINFMQGTPATWQMLVQAGWQGKSNLTVLSGGEILSPILAEALLSRVNHVFNGYGPTEATLYSLVHKVTNADCKNTRIPIGVPLANIEHFVVNKQFELLPIGMVGELLIAGMGVAKGYINLPHKTAEKFLSLPELTAKICYRSGDLVCLKEEGIFEYHGRLDEQVKIHGYRIELIEIETQLLQLEKVNQATVLVYVSQQQHKFLVGYLVLNIRLSKTDENQFFVDIEDDLREKIPEYMIPKVWIILPSLPVSANGKIDKHKLQQIPLPVTENQSGKLPSNDTERWLATKYLHLFFGYEINRHLALNATLNKEGLNTESHFFHLGGNSLSAIQLTNWIRQSFAKNIAIRDIFQFPTIRLLARHIDSLPTEFEPILTIENIKKSSKLTPQDQSLQQTELSFEQQGLWFLQQFTVDDTSYHMSFALEIANRIDETMLRTALVQLSQRHELLRARFPVSHGKAQLKILAADPIPLLALFPEKSEQTSWESIQERMSVVAQQPFMLEQDQLVRAHHHALSPHRHLLQLTLHHLIADGWSLGILVRDLFSFYLAQQEREPVKLPRLDVSYLQYIHWQHAAETKGFYQSAQHYWLHQLEELPLVHRLPLDHPREPQKLHSGQSLIRYLPNKVQFSLTQMANELNTSLFNLMYSGFSALLSRISGEYDIVIATPVANRQMEELHDVVGLFVNTLVLRCQINQDMTFIDFVEQCDDIVTHALKYQELPFEQLVELLNPPRQLGYHPIAQVMLSMQGHRGDVGDIPNLDIRRLHIATSSSKFDLTLAIEQVDDKLALEWEYNSNIFEQNSIEQLADSFEILLQAILHCRQQKLGHICLSLVPEEHCISTPTEQVTDNSLSLLARIYQQAQRQPQAPAIQLLNTTVTYEQLTQRVDGLAQQLLAVGVIKNQLVSVCLEPSVDMVVSLLAIHRVQAAYLPIDINIPYSRLQKILQDSRCQLCITHEEIKNKFPLLQEKCELIDPNADYEKTYQGTLPSLAYDKSLLAYVLYTSGTTGEPKGVLMPLEALKHHIDIVTNYYELSHQDKVFQLTNLGFDPASEQIWGALTVGGCIILPMEQVFDSQAFSTQVLAQGITVIDLPPSYANQVLLPLLEDKYFWQVAKLRLILIGGERFPVEIAQLWQKNSFAHHCRLLNVYGPTEACITSFSHEIVPGRHYHKVPLGLPLANTFAAVVDTKGEPLPPGIVGELVVAGMRLAWGYLNRPDLTAERFSCLHSSYYPGLRIYKTGDQVRLNQQGEIEFIGRIDNQVKLRGFRIEPSEIELALQDIIDIQQAVVCLQPSHDQQEQLVAYLKRANAETKSTIPVEGNDALIRLCRETLCEKLPEYMIPNAFIVLNKMPLMLNGKIDYAALPKPSATDVIQNSYTAPENEIEDKLCQIWEKLLQQEHIGVDDNFFALGGHSLLATRLVSEIRETWHCEIPIRTIFTEPSIRELAKIITIEENLLSDSAFPPIKTIPRNQPLPLSYSQQRLWFIHQLEGGSAQYNMVGAFRLLGAFDIQAFCSAMNTIIERHEVLRTQFIEIDGAVQAIIKPEFELPITKQDLKRLSPSAQQKMLTRIARDDAYHSFDLSSGLLIRLHLLTLAEEEQVVLFNLHHIAADGWSITILINEFKQLYDIYHRGEGENLPALTIQYVDYARWQRDWLKGQHIEESVDFWLKKLSDLPVLHNLPTDKSRPTQQSFKGDHLKIYLDQNLTKAIQRLCHKFDVTPFIFLQSTFAILLSKLSREQDIVMATSIAGRTQKAIEPLIGFFVNTLVLRNIIDRQCSFVELLKINKYEIIDVYTHQHVPFDMLVDKINPQRTLSHNPLAQILFSFHNNEQSQLVFDAVGIEQLHLIKRGSQYDLELNIEEIEGRLLCHWQFCTDLFSEKSIQHYVDSYQQLISEVLAEPNQRIEQLSIVSASQQSELLTYLQGEKINTTVQPALLHRFIEQQTVATATATATYLEDETLTYAELDAKANQLGRFLIAQGLKNQQLVGIMLEPGMHIVVAILAILKTGCAYVPLDVTWPAARKTQIITNAAIQVVLTSNEFIGELMVDNTLFVPIDTEFAHRLFGHFSTNNLSAELLDQHETDLAYLIYTSGTTGEPKGVEVEHRALVDYCLGARAVYYSDYLSGSIIATSFAFDATIPALFLPLYYGGYVQWLTSEQRISQLWLTLLTHQDALLVRITPAHIQGLRGIDIDEHSCDLHHHFVIGGDVLTPAAVQLLRQYFPNSRIFNHYGPTEAIVGCSIHEITALSDPLPRFIPIGRPLPNASLYVFDEQQQLVPWGSIGELYIGRTYLARGYHHRTELTTQKFITNPYLEQHPDIPLLYKSGDLVRLSAEGDLEYIGRNDNQIKLRGYRIELTEIENLLNQLPEIKLSCVSCQNINGQLHLIAYIVLIEAIIGEDDLSLERQNRQLRQNWRSWLKGYLPNYMIPSIFMQISQIPLSANGKINRHALPKLETKDLQQANYKAPEGVIQSILCDIWQGLLGIEQIGVEDNFFELGGDSIISIQVVARAQQKGISLTVRQLFEYQTIAALTPQVTFQEQHYHPPQGWSMGANQLTPVQTRFFEQITIDHHHFNQSVLLSTPANFSVDLLKKIVAALYRRHDSLRLIFKKNKTTWSAEYTSFNETLLNQSVYYFQNKEVSLVNKHYDKDTLDKLQQSFTLEQGPLFRAALFQENDTNQPGRLLLLAHHLIIDSFSWRILLADFISVYQQLSQEQRAELPDKTNAYQQWAQALADYAQTPELKNEQSWWLHQLEQAKNSQSPVLLRNTAIEQSTNNGIGQLNFRLSVTHTQWLLGSANHLFRTQINELLLAALFFAYSKTFDDYVLALELESHGRENIFPHLNINETLGWFSTHFPLVMHMMYESNLGQVVRYVKEQTRKIPKKGIDFSVLTHLLKDDAILQAKAGNPYQHIRFNYLGRFDQYTKPLFPFALLQEDKGTEYSAEQDLDSHIILTGWVSDEQLIFDVLVDEQQIDLDAVNEWVTCFRQTLQSMATQFSLPQEKQPHSLKTLTPSDFPLVPISLRQIDQLPLSHLAIETLYPTTPMQQGLLFHGLFDESGASYTNQLCCVLLGALDIIAFERAWQKIIERHAIFRTSIILNTGISPIQLVQHQVDIHLTYLDWTTFSTLEQQQQLMIYRQEDKAFGFDFNQAPLIRIHLIKLAEHRHYFIWTHHHILTDGWSTPLVFKEVFQIYQSECEGTELRLPKTAQFEQYLQWLMAQDEKQAIQFWRDYLQPISGPNQLAFIQPTQNNQQQPCTHQQIIEGHLLKKLRQVAKQYHCTLNTVFQLAWGIVLKRYCDEEHIVFGTTISGRPAQVHHIEQIVGLFINTLPICISFDQPLGIAEQLQQLHKKMAEIESMGYLSLAHIQRLVNEQAQPQLFQSLLIFENYPVNEQELGQLLAVSGLAMEELNTVEQTNYALTLTIQLAQHLVIDLAFYEPQVSGSQALALLEHFKQTLTQLSELKGSTLVNDVSILTPIEQQRLITWQGNIHSQQITSLPAIFETSVAQYPERIAIIDGEEQITYAELEDLSNTIAYYLVSLRIEKEESIGVYADRSLYLIASLLGILKAGGCYVPLTKSYPEQRLIYISEDAHIQYIISDDIEQSKSLFRQQKHIQCDQQSIAALKVKTKTQKLPIIYPNQLAYILYTSGTTGQPKGVLIEHQAVCYRLHWLSRKIQLTQNDVFLQKTPITFDVSVWEIYWPISLGASVVIPEVGIERDVEQMSVLIAQHQVSVINFVPSLLNVFLMAGIEESCRSLQHILASGEPLLADTITRFQKSDLNAKLYNLYGPTEATVDITFYDCTQWQPEQSVPLGEIADNSVAIILDSDYHPVPVGAIGDLYLGGVGIARGYLNRGQAMKTQFISVPEKIKNLLPIYQSHHIGISPYLYLTGDRVRRLENGALEFIGRQDQQVKVRGYRIELSEIEHRIQQIHFIEQAVVIIDDDIQPVQIVAFVVPKKLNKIDAIQHEIVTELSQYLPGYMLPQQIVVLEHLPLNDNGKLDRKQLIIPVRSNIIAAHEKASTPMETKMVSIWQQVLKQENLGVNDNFFELGGDSILSIQLVSLARQQGMQFSVRQLFEAKTINQLLPRVKWVEQQANLQPETGEFKLLPIQKTFFAWELPEQDHFNQSVLVTTPTQMNREHLVQITQALYQRHDLLRARFLQQGEQWLGRYEEQSPVMLQKAIQIYDLKGSTQKEQQQALQDYCAQMQRSLDIEQGVVFKLVWFDFGTDPGRLLFILHHLIVDGVSWRILLADFEQAYVAASQGKKIELASKTASYKQFAEQLYWWLDNGEMASEQSFWLEQLQPQCANLEKLFSHKKPQNKNTLFKIQFSLNSTYTNALIGESNMAFRTQTDELLIASFSQTIREWADETHLLFEIESHGRDCFEHIALTDTLGWFTVIYPIQIKLPETSEFEAVVKQVKEQLRQVPNKGHGYGLLTQLAQDQELLFAAKSMAGKQIVFNYLGQFDQTEKNSQHFSQAPESVGPERSEKQNQRAIIVVNSWVINGELTFELSVKSELIPEMEVVSLVRIFETTLKDTVMTCHRHLEQRRLYSISKAIISPDPVNLANGVEI